jgi:hypothetical protein
MVIIPSLARSLLLVAVAAGISQMLPVQTVVLVAEEVVRHLVALEIPHRFHLLRAIMVVLVVLLAAELMLAEVGAQALLVIHIVHLAPLVEVMVEMEPHHLFLGHP